MNRIELVKNKFPRELKKALAINDPSGNNKYLLWVAQQLKNKHNSADISATIQNFHNNSEKFEEKDIYKYKDLKELENLFKKMGLTRRQKRQKDKENAKKIFENDNLVCVRVDDKQAMITYGAGTKWCTTMKDYSYYESYVAEGNYFYIVIAKKKKYNQIT